jgi:hypothetical protein
MVVEVVIAEAVQVPKHVQVLTAVQEAVGRMAVRVVLGTHLALLRHKVATAGLEAQVLVTTVQVAAVVQVQLAQMVLVLLAVTAVTERHQASQVPL